MLAYHRLLSVSSLSLIILLYCAYSSDETLPFYALKLSRTNRKHEAEAIQEPRTCITGINSSCAKGKKQSVTDQIILIESRILSTQESPSHFKKIFILFTQTEEPPSKEQHFQGFL